MPVYQNVTRRIYFQSVTTAGADNTATTPTVKISQNGGAQATATNAPSHLGTGQWVVVLTAAEMNAGEVSVNHSASGCVSGVVTVYPEADYTSTRSAKLDNADVATSTRMATFTLPANFSALSISAAGLVDILQTAADKVWGTTTRALTDKVGFALSAAGVQAVWDALSSALTTASSIGKLLVDNINATISSRSTYAGGAVASVTGNVGGNVVGSVGSVAAGGIAASTFATDAINANALATDAGQEIADRVLARNVGGGSDTGRTVKEAVAVLRNKVAISGGTLTVYATDDTTVLFTAVVTTAAGNPLSSIDPA